MRQTTALALATLLGAALAFAGPPPHAFHGIATDAPPAADFTLTAHTGRRARLADFRGKLVLLYFGYTSCPGVCPTTLADLDQALKALGSKRAARAQVVMVTVDPGRDTPGQLAVYMKHFNPSFLGVTGTPEEIAAVASRYGIYVRKQEGAPGTGYLVDHTSLVLVVDEARRVRLVFPFGTSARDMAEDLAHLLR